MSVIPLLAFNDSFQGEADGFNYVDFEVNYRGADMVGFTLIARGRRSAKSFGRNGTLQGIRTGRKFVATDFKFRRNAVGTLTNQIGVYILADLDNVPIYVGQSTDGIRSRVQRHLTSARSDIIANRQSDVSEIAFVWAYPVTDRAELDPLEATLFHHFDPTSKLMNGKTPPKPSGSVTIPDQAQIAQVMSDEDIADKKDPAQRLPRQAGHYAQIVGHFLTVKNSVQIAQAMHAHFERLSRYHATMLDLGSDEE